MYLTKTNSDTLTILTTNNYTGVTTISGGVLSIAQIANGSSASAIGAASSDQANLVITNATLEYTGPNASTVRGATIGGTADFDIASTNSLAIDGSIVGSGGLTTVGPGTLILADANSYGGPTTLNNGVLQVNTTSSAINNTIVFMPAARSTSMSAASPIIPIP